MVSVALVANLIAAGVPVLHAWAHDVGHAHEVIVTVPAEVDHPHDEVHPLALHDECVLTHRVGLPLSPALPASRVEFASPVAEDVPDFHPVPPVSSRAPPGRNHARAPPLA